MKLRGIRGVHAGLLELACHFNALAFHRHADQGLVAVMRPLRGIGQQADPVSLGAVGGPHLAAVDDVVVAILAGECSDRCHIRARADFRHAQASHILAADRRLQKLAFDLVRTVLGQRWRRHVGLHADRHRHTAALDVRERFSEGGGIRIVEPHSAVGDRLVDAEKAEFAHFFEEFMGWKNLGFLPLIDMRIDFGVDELFQRVLKLDMVWAIERAGGRRVCSGVCGRACGRMCSIHCVVLVVGGAVVTIVNANIVI